jgi:CheY-like chemotaxis protein
MAVQKKRILVVDDEAKFTRLLKRYLEQSGAYEVREEHQGERALAAARQFHPDVILLDVVMPDLDGGTVAAQLKDDPALRHTPIVFLTAAVSPEEVEERSGVIGGHPFLAKPVDIKDVLACIQQHLG